jgi:hypothetical protein
LPQPEFRREIKETIAAEAANHGGGEVISKSRFVLALGLTLALGIAAVSYGDANKAPTATVEVIGAVSPTDAKGTQPSKPIAIKHGKEVAVTMYTAVATHDNVTGTQANPVAEVIDFGKLVDVDPSAVPQCNNLPPSGSTPQQAKDACGKSFLGSGSAELTTPGGGKISDVVVSAFAGKVAGDTRKDPGVLLHTWSQTLGQAAPTVPGYIAQSKSGSKYGEAFDVPHAPETGSLQIDYFGTNIDKGTKTVLASCNKKKGKKGKFLWMRTSTFSDGSKLTASASQPCKAK